MKAIICLAVMMAVAAGANPDHEFGFAFNAIPDDTFAPPDEMKDLDLLESPELLDIYEKARQERLLETKAEMLTLPDVPTMPPVLKEQDNRAVIRDMYGNIQLVPPPRPEKLSDEELAIRKGNMVEAAAIRARERAEEEARVKAVAVASGNVKVMNKVPTEMLAGIEKQADGSRVALVVRGDGQVERRPLKTMYTARVKEPKQEEPESESSTSAGVAIGLALGVAIGAGAGAAVAKKGG